jgi:hypothetical protein
MRKGDSSDEEDDQFKFISKSSSMVGSERDGARVSKMSLNEQRHYENKQ